MLKDKSILLISPQSWDHIFVSKHHYAITLAEYGNRVTFLNPPSNYDGIKESQYKSLFIANYRGFLPGMRFFPKAIRKWLTRRSFRKIEKISNTSFDIIWSFDNSVFFDFDVLPKRVYAISHIVDLNQDFQMNRASSSANICIGVIKEIVNKHRLYNSSSYLISHGVSINTHDEDIKLLGDNSLKALYFGNLAMPHLDWDLINIAVSTHAEVDFIFIGSNPNHALLRDQKNAIVIDQVDAEMLTSYMRRAHVLMLFYTEKYLRNYASPHKMLEYLSSGKPIISNYFPEYKHLNQLLYMSNSHVEWLDKFKLALQEGGRVNEERIKVAAEHTYYKKVGEVEKLIDLHPNSEKNG